MREVDMLTAYINAAMRKARYEILPDGEGYFGISLNGDDEHKDWLRISQSALEQAYSSDNPRPRLTRSKSRIPTMKEADVIPL
jgi:hypothetical protein